MLDVRARCIAFLLRRPNGAPVYIPGTQTCVARAFIDPKVGGRIGCQEMSLSGRTGKTHVSPPLEGHTLHKASC